tara:strand:+ start:709 stop:909 length:201 start_codon:yes stop_codon:yes gene_type:complete
MFLGENLIILLVLAFGAALAAGNFLALVNTKDAPDDRDYERPPLFRSITMILIGLIAAIWAIVSLL